LYDQKTRSSDYYDSKLFIYDWIRGWIKVVTLRENGDYDKMEPFLPDESFANPIDMEVGKDGRLYILEYGRGWFAKNDDAGIVRVDYNAGNLPPQVGEVTFEKVNGATPFTVRASVEASDYENDKLTYTWKIGDVEQETSEPTLTYTLEKSGEYPVSVTVSDPSGNRAVSNTTMVYAGNEEPVVEILLSNTSGRYSPGERIE